MLAVAVPKRNKLQNIIVLTPKDGSGLTDKPFYSMIRLGLKEYVLCFLS